MASYVSFWILLPLTIGYVLYRIGVTRTHKIRDEHDKVAREQTETDVLSRVLDKTIKPKDVERAIRATKTTIHEHGQSKAKIRSVEKERDDARLQSTDLRAEVSRLEAERNKATQALASEQDIVKQTKEQVVRLTDALGFGSDLDKVIPALAAERDDLRRTTDKSTRLEAEFKAFVSSTGLDDLVKAAATLRALQRLAAEREDARDKARVEIKRLADALEDQRKAGEEAIDKAIHETQENEKSRELKDYIVVRPFVLVKRGHGVMHNGLPFPNGKVTLSFGLTVTNYGRRGVLLRELRDIFVGVNWDSDIRDCEAGTPVGTRVIPGDQFIDVGHPDVPFFELDPIDIQTPPMHNPPMMWSQFGTAVIKASLWVAVANTRDDPFPVLMHIDFHEFISVPFTLTLSPHARVAVNTIMRTLAGRNIEPDASNKLVQCAIASLDGGSK